MDDVRTVLGQLRVEMEDTKDEHKRITFHHFHTRIRLIDDLIRYTMNSLHDRLEQAEDIKNMIFAKIVKEDEIQNDPYSLQGVEGLIKKLYTSSIPYFPTCTQENK